MDERIVRTSTQIIRRDPVATKLSDFFPGCESSLGTVNIVVAQRLVSVVEKQFGFLLLATRGIGLKVASPSASWKPNLYNRRSFIQLTLPTVVYRYHPDLDVKFQDVVHLALARETDIVEKARIEKLGENRIWLGLRVQQGL